MVNKIGLFFGTQTGNTESQAEVIAKLLGNVDMYDIAKAAPQDLQSYACLIIGCPTWNVGEMVADWDGFYPDLDQIDFSGKKIAYFGCGDQVGYADNFMDAVGILEERISELGGQTVGYWPITGYEFNQSRAVRGEQFVGLAIDEDNQPELTDQRVKTWVQQLKREFDA